MLQSHALNHTVVLQRYTAPRVEFPNDAIDSLHYPSNRGLCSDGRFEPAALCPTFRVDSIRISQVQCSTRVIHQRAGFNTVLTKSTCWVALLVATGTADINIDTQAVRRKVLLLIISRHSATDGNGKSRSNAGACLIQAAAGSKISDTSIAAESAALKAVEETRLRRMRKTHSTYC
nr:hypothetical protein CFP56_32445 [Quercus suber]